MFFFRLVTSVEQRKNSEWLAQTTCQYHFELFSKTGFICQKLCGKMRPDNSSKSPKYHPLWVVKKTNKDISPKGERKVKCRKKFNLRKKFWSLKWLQRPQKNRKTKIWLQTLMLWILNAGWKYFRSNWQIWMWI